jgi:hypothetical protein
MTPLRFARTAVRTLAELAGLGAAVIVDAMPARYRDDLSRRMHRLGDRALLRWPAALVLGTVGAGFAVRLAWHRRAVRRRKAQDGRR